MHQHEFDTQMARLKDTFGDSKYGEERTELIWVEVKNFTEDWFRAVVSELIGSSAFAPLLPAFREHCSKERERLRGIDRQRESNDAREFWSLHSFPTDEVKLIFDMTRAQMRGEIDDVKWESFQSQLKNIGMSGPNAPKCKRCEDDGLVWSEYVHDGKPYSQVHRCRCHAGAKQTQSIPQENYMSYRTTQ